MLSLVDDATPKDEGDTTETPPDRVYVHSKSGDDSYRVIRSRDSQLEIGELRTLREGQPIVGELVRLAPSADDARLFDVEVLMEAPQPARGKGPAKVATGAYRAGWDKIFSAPLVGETSGRDGTLN